MELIAVIFLTGLVLGYFVLASCDVGLGMLLTHTCRTPAERRRGIRAMAPLFLGTEVWLVAAIGVVAGVFPALKDELLPWSWPVLLALLAGWLTRDAGLWLWARVDTASWQRTWELAITAGSWALAGAWGLFLGGLLTGNVLNPLAMSCAVAVTALFALRGATFGAERLVPAPSEPTDSQAADVAGQSIRWLARIALVAVLCSGVIVAVQSETAFDRGPVAFGLALALAATLVPALGRSGPWWSRHTSGIALALAVLVVLLGVRLPGLSPEPATLSLVWLSVAPALPVMVLGQVWLYVLLRRPAYRNLCPEDGSARPHSQAPAGFFA